jgi:hypothetical protein
MARGSHQEQVIDTVGSCPSAGRVNELAGRRYQPASIDRGASRDLPSSAPEEGSEERKTKG